MGGSAVELAILLTAKDAASGVLSNVSSKFAGLGAAAKVVVAGVAAAGALIGGTVTALTALAVKSAAAAGEVAKLKRETGLTAEEASKLKFAGERLGLGVDELSAAFKKFDGNLLTNQDRFKELGIQITKNKQGNIDFLPTLGNVADKFAGMPPGVEKSALAVELFGKKGLEMIPFLDKGKGGLKELGDKAKDLGLVFDDQTLGAAKRYRESQKDIAESFEGLKNKIGTAVLPILADFSIFLMGLVNGIFPAVVKSIDTLRGWFVTLTGVIKDMAKAFQGNMTGGGDFLGSLIGPKAAADFMANVKKVGDKWDEVWTNNIKPALLWGQTNVPIIWEDIKTGISMAWSKIEPKLTSFVDKLGDLKGKFEALPDPVRKALEDVALATVVVKVTPLDDFVNTVANSAQGVGGLAAAAVALKGKWIATLVAMATAGAVLLAIASIVVAVYEIFSAIGEVRDHWEELRKAVHDGSLKNKDAVEDFLSRLVTWGDMFDALGHHTQSSLAEWQIMFNNFKDAVSLIWPSIVLVAQTAWTNILISLQTMVNSGIDAINPFWTMLGHPPIPHVVIELPNKEWAENEINNIARHRNSTIDIWETYHPASQNATPHALGTDRLVTQPELIRVGEAGPEWLTVTPLGRGRGGGSGGNTYITINADVVDAQALDRFADKIGARWTQARRMQGLA